MKKTDKVGKKTAKKAVKKTVKKVKKTVKKKPSPTPSLGYRRKILNPNTGRYVFLESKKGKELTARLEKIVKKKKPTKAEIAFRDEILYSKFCKCTKSIIISESKKECPDRKLPYAVCTYNVYNRKGLRIPSNGSRGCRTKFTWYN